MVFDVVLLSPGVKIIVPGATERRSDIRQRGCTSGHVGNLIAPDAANIQFPNLFQR